VGGASSAREGDALTDKLLATIALLTGRVDALQEALLTQQQQQVQRQAAPWATTAATSTASPVSTALRSSKGRWAGDSEDAPTWAEWARTEAQLATAGLVVVAVLLVAVKVLLVVLTYVRGGG
jgi:hypothetical protein